LFIAGVLAQINVREIDQPVCVPNDPSGTCTLTARTRNNGGTPQGQIFYDNQISLGVAASATVISGSHYDVFFKYQPLKNQPPVAQGQITLLDVYDWDDTNGDHVPQDSELGTPQPLSAPQAPSYPKFNLNGLPSQLTYVPYAVSVNEPAGNFNLSCYIVKNYTYLYPDGTLSTGYDGSCTLSVSGTVMPGHRLALKVGLTSSLGSVSSSTFPLVLAPYSGTVMGTEVGVGGLYFTWKDKATPLLGNSATGNLNAGNFEASAEANTLNVVFGFDVPDASGFSWDFRFSPVSINGAAQTVTALAFVVAAVATLLL